jgi:cysteinyl-tRNA synthetase
LKDEKSSEGDEKLTSELINIIINLRQDAKNKREFEVSDKIRQELTKIGILIKDKKDGLTDWEKNPL